ncbi:KTSC domain-containing protein [Neisseriaceae bacterium ESL0693]|nr:KTSC domain-containing protein [Neisseriaceae bacterium ESL0693]
MRSSNLKSVGDENKILEITFTYEITYQYFNIPAAVYQNLLSAVPRPVYKAVAEDGSKRKVIKEISSLLTMTLGIPVTALVCPVGYFAYAQSGDIAPTSAANAIRVTITSHQSN